MPNSDALEWNDAMLTGVVEIDQQHRILVDTLIGARLNLSGSLNDPLFDPITRDLLAYAIYHFDTEERLMARYEYAANSPDATAAHLAQHRSFSERVIALRNEAREGRPGSREALLAFLENWLINHIMTSDHRLGEFILEKC